MQQTVPLAAEPKYVMDHFPISNRFSIPTYRAPPHIQLRAPFLLNIVDWTNLRMLRKETSGRLFGILPTAPRNRYKVLRYGCKRNENTLQDVGSEKMFLIGLGLHNLMHKM